MTFDDLVKMEPRLSKFRQGEANKRVHSYFDHKAQAYRDLARQA